MSNHEQRKFEAQKHIALMRGVFQKENMDAVATHRHYKDGSMFETTGLPSRFDRTEIIVKDADSVSALLEESNPKAVLDFASFHNPGGGYENGAWAQEEALCSESNLYIVLNELYNEYYRPHRNCQRGGLYTSDALYLQDIQFVRGGKIEPCDVIVMAAPNAKAARKSNRSETEIEGDLRRRVFSVLNIAHDNEIDNLVLGAFGCGVFANDPRKVAAMFKEWIDDNDGAFARVVFAIPADGKNLPAFQEVFESH